DAKLLIMYSSAVNRSDARIGIASSAIFPNVQLDYHAFRLPIYGNVLTFAGVGKTVVSVRQPSAIAGLKIGAPGRTILRLGYDLFREVSFLLSVGQPPENAALPTLEIH